MSDGYLTITHISGDPEELLAGHRRSAATMTEVGRDHGLILHAAAKDEEGLLIVNLWPSQEGSESASRDPRRLGVIAEQRLDPGQMRRSTTRWRTTSFSSAVVLPEYADRARLLVPERDRCEHGGKAARLGPELPRKRSQGSG